MHSTYIRGCSEGCNGGEILTSRAPTTSAGEAFPERMRTLDVLCRAKAPPHGSRPHGSWFVTFVARPRRLHTRFRGAARTRPGRLPSYRKSSSSDESPFASRAFCTTLLDGGRAPNSTRASGPASRQRNGRGSGWRTYGVARKRAAAFASRCVRWISATHFTRTGTRAIGCISGRGTDDRANASNDDEHRRGAVFTTACLAENRCMMHTLRGSSPRDDAQRDPLPTSCRPTKTIRLRVTRTRGLRWAEAASVARRVNAVRAMQPEGVPSGGALFVAPDA